MSILIQVDIQRDGQTVYSNIPVQVDKYSPFEAASISNEPNYTYECFVKTILPDLRENDYIVDRTNVNPVTNSAKAYQIISEPESFPLDNHMELFAIRADRAMLTRGNNAS